MSQTLITKSLCALCAAVLCACGSSDQTPAVPAPPPVVVVADLPATVERLVTDTAATSDTTEPVVIDTLVVPAPDDSEPRPL